MEDNHIFAEAYKKIIDSKIGKYVMDKLISYKNSTLTKLFNQIPKNIKNNVYRDKKTFFNDFVNTNKYIARTFSQTSEIGLGLETLNQMLEDALNFDKVPKSKKEYKEMIIQYIVELQQVIERMPNNYKEYVNLYHHKEQQVNKMHNIIKPKEYPNEEFQMERLQRILLRLNSDFEIGEIAELVLIYEIDPRADGCEKTFELFLDKCDPQFLQLLWNYLKAYNFVE